MIVRVRNDKRIYISAVAKAIVVFVVLTLLATNIAGWKVEDDEGSGLYAAWRFAENEKPYLDFASSMAPLYLVVGRTLVRLFGRDLLLLRAASAVALSAGMGVLVWVIGRVWNESVACFFWSMTLLTPEIYHLTRVFRSDSIMLALVLPALAAALLHLKRQKRSLLFLSGLLFGLASTAKVVAFMPFLGVALWLLWRGLVSRKVRQSLLDLLWFVAAAGAVSLVCYGVLESAAPGAFAAIVTSPGHYSSPLFSRMLNGIIGWTALIWTNWSLLLGLPAVFMVKRHIRDDSMMFWMCQILGSAPFFVLSSPPYPRYLAYVAPSLIMLFLSTLPELGLRLPSTVRPSYALLGLLLSVALGWLGKTLLLRRETDTAELAAWIRQHTEPTDVVVSDYAEINFHAGRRSIPQQAVISHNWASTGLVTGEELAQDMERLSAQMVIIHIEGGQVPPQHLHYLADYDEFRNYLLGNYGRARVWNRAGQRLEIWQRE